MAEEPRCCRPAHAPAVRTVSRCAGLALPLFPLGWGWRDTSLLDRALWAESCQGRQCPGMGQMCPPQPEPNLLMPRLY